MRDIPAPHQGLTYSTGDFLALWSCNEPSGSLTDSTGAYTAAVVSGAIGVAGSLYRAPAGTTGSRTFSNSRATAAGNAVARTVLLGEWSISVWLQPSSTSTVQTVLAYAGGNTLASLYLDAAGVPFVSWRRGTSIISATATKAIAAGVASHVFVVKELDPAVAGRYRVRFYVNGAEAGVVGNLQTADGGTTSPQWSIGTDGSGGSPYSGSIDDLAVLPYPASHEMAADVYARGVSDVDQQTTYAADSYQVRARVTVEQPDGVRVDLSSVYGWDLVRSIDMEDDVDAQGASATIHLVRDVYEVNVAPLMSASAPNVDAGGSLLALNRRVRIETATVPDGTTDDAVVPWALMFDGFIEGIDYGDDIITLDCFDRMLALQDTWIEPDRSDTTKPPVDRSYGSTLPNVFDVPVETAMQQLIADNVPPFVGYVGGTPTIYTPTSPAWGLNNVVVPSQNSVAGQLEQWASEIGWLVRYKFDDDRKAFRLTFYEPLRNKVWTSSDPRFTPSQVLSFSQLEVRRDDIRNFVEVEYGDAGVDDDVGQWQRLLVTASDSTSIAKYGRRYCRVSIGSAQEINNQTQAQRLASNILADLKEPKADAEVELLYRHYVEVGDVVRFDADGQRFDSPQAFAVVSVSHSLSDSQRRTRLRLRSASPIGKRTRWWDMLATPGRIAAASNRPPPAPTDVQFTATLGGVRLRWAYPVNAGARRYLETEIHRSSVNNFSPSASTLVATVRGKSTAVLEQLPGATWYYKLRHRDVDGNVSADSAQRSTVSNTLSAQYVPAAWRCAASVKQTTAQTINLGSAVDTKLSTMTTLIAVTGPTGWDSVAQQWVAPASGVYFVSATLGMSMRKGDAVGLRLRIKGDGTDYRAGHLAGNGVSFVSAFVSGSWAVVLDEGQELDFVVTGEAGKALELTTVPERTMVSISFAFPTA